MIAIVDYGVGNLFSLKSSFAMIGEEAVATRDPELIKKADKLVLPGVGAFEDAAKKLRSSGLWDLVVSEARGGKPLLGICLGMQMLFDRSLEYGSHEGLGLISGEIRPISEVIPEGLKIPHIGWNPLIFKKESRLFKYIKSGDCVYFVHSYSARGCEESISATSEYGAELCASVESGNIYGCQFHPEKSGKVGLSILKAFAESEVQK